MKRKRACFYDPVVRHPLPSRRLLSQSLQGHSAVVVHPPVAGQDHRLVAHTLRSKLLREVAVSLSPASSHCCAAIVACTTCARRAHPYIQRRVTTSKGTPSVSIS